MDMIGRFFEAIFANGVSMAFASTIVMLLVWAILARFIELFKSFDSLYRAGPTLYRAGPTLLPTLGVLGTFVGITIGLLDFDVSNIDKSVPQLLDGLKVAFLTSIVGLGAAIVLRGVQIFTPKPETEETEVTPEVIHAALTAIKEGIDKAAAQEHESLEDLRKSISADSDSSLLTQVQKLRTDFKDGQNELIKEFRRFAETMAENNSKALIEALEQVIRDFNTQLNEQFGDNFKQLNEAVSALLIWQENYREHVEALERRLEEAVQATEASEQALSKIVSHTEQLPETLQNLRDILKGLDEHLTTVAELKDKAIEAFPVIDDNLTKLTDRLGKSVQQAIQRSDITLQHQQDAHDKLHQGFDTLSNKAQRSQEQFENALKETLSKAESEFEKLSPRLEQTLHESIEVMGGHLASLSEKFVEDYTPLTDKLRLVVQIANGRDT